MRVITRRLGLLTILFRVFINLARVDDYWGFEFAAEREEIRSDLESRLLSITQSSLVRLPVRLAATSYEYCRLTVADDHKWLFQCDLSVGSRDRLARKIKLTFSNFRVTTKSGESISRRAVLDRASENPKSFHSRQMPIYGPQAISVASQSH